MQTLTEVPANIRSRNLWLIFGVAFSGCLYGYNIGAISGVLLFLNKATHLSALEQAAFVSSFLWGTSIAVLAIGYVADALGRKKALLIATLTALLSIVLMVLANSIAELIAARFLVGIASGMLVLTTPLYLSEVMPSQWRGRGTVAFQLFLCFGILLSTLVSLYCATFESWKPIFVFELLPALIVLVFVSFASESPRWLILKNKTDHALHVLMRTRSKAQAETSLDEITRSTQGKRAVSLKTLLTQKQFLRPLLLVVAIGSLNQLTGINTILQYDSTILFSDGFHSHSSALLGSTGITAINFIATIIALLIVDKVERKTLLRVGLVGIIICLATLSIVLHFTPIGAVRSTIITSALFGFIICFAVAPGAVIWALMAETLPFRIRSVGLSIALFLSAISGATLSTLFLPLEHVIGQSGVFLVCASTTLVYVLISFWLPKTRGQSLEAIEQKTTK